MKQTTKAISAAELGKLTGDNRKWIYRQAKAGRIPSMRKDGALGTKLGPGTGPGNGLQFHLHDDLERWIEARRQKRLSRIASLDKFEHLVTEAQDALAGINKPKNLDRTTSVLYELANVACGNRFHAQINRIRGAGKKKALADALQTVARDLDYAASEIRKTAVPVKPMRME